MSRRIKIHDEVVAVCERLGLVPNNVAELVITPRKVVATVYKINENGRKYVIPGPDAPPPDLIYGPSNPEVESVPATETHEFEVVA